MAKFIVSIKICLPSINFITKLKRGVMEVNRLNAVTGMIVKIYFDVLT